MVQTHGCSSLSQMYRNERQSCCINRVTSLLWLIVVNSLKNSDSVNTWGFYGLNYGNCSAWIYVCTCWNLKHLPWNYFLLQTVGYLLKELHNLKAVIFLQIDNWVITSFFFKRRGKLTSLILLKEKKVISAVCWVFSILMFSSSCCLTGDLHWTALSGDLHWTFTLSSIS